MHRNSPPSPHGRYSSDRPLKRGKACLTCRFLKIKCDGKRPVCGPCLMHPKDDPCEYADGPGRSRYKALEETITRLETRIKELENPDNASPSVALIDPYLQQSTSSTLPLQTLPMPQPLPSYSPMSPLLTVSPTSSPSGSVSSGLPATGKISIDDPKVIQSLVSIFLPHATQLGFFLDTQGFYRSIFQPPNNASIQPCSSLLRTVCLWGSHISLDRQTHSLEHDLLLLALSESATTLTTSLYDRQPNHIIETIQAETLLSYYFFRRGDILLARKHSGAAASLVIGCGLHQLRASTDVPPKPLAVSSNMAIHLPGARDSLEEGQRINAFWVVLTLTHNLALASEMPSTVYGIFESPGLYAHSPWPLDVKSYRDGQLPPHNHSTIQTYLSMGLSSQKEASQDSIAALIAKASILFHHATHVASLYCAGMQVNSRSYQNFISQFQHTAHLILEFYQVLPHWKDETPERTSNLYLAFAMTRCATIRLRSPFLPSDANSRQACVAAARDILQPEDLDLFQFQCLNPIMGTIWMNACQVLINEISAMRSEATSWDSDEADIRSSLEAGMSVVNRFSGDSLLMRYQLTKIQEASAAIR